MFIQIYLTYMIILLYVISSKMVGNRTLKFEAGVKILLFPM